MRHTDTRIKIDVNVVSYYKLVLVSIRLRDNTVVVLSIIITTEFFVYIIG